LGLKEGERVTSAVDTGQRHARPTTRQAEAVAIEGQRAEDQRIRESQRQQTEQQRESERHRRESERQWQGTLQRQPEFIQQSRVDSARYQLQLDQNANGLQNKQAQLQMDRDNYGYEQEQQRRLREQQQQQREQQRWEDANRKRMP